MKKSTGSGTKVQRLEVEGGEGRAHPSALLPEGG